MENGYNWDVFLSYRRLDPIDIWVKEYFRRMLEAELREQLHGNKPRIFLDQDDIRTGDIWPNAIANAIRTSKSLIAVWTPSYFQSKWCLAEWESFLERAKLCDLNDYALAAPILWIEGGGIPREATHVECLDFSKFSFYGAAFENTTIYIEMQAKVRELAPQVRGVIERAPPFQQDWPFDPPRDVDPRYDEQDPNEQGPAVPKPEF